MALGVSRRTPMGTATPNLRRTDSASSIVEASLTVGPDLDQILRVYGFGRFPKNAHGNCNAELAQNGLRVLYRRGIAHRRTRPDDVQTVADNIGENQRDHSGRMRRGGQLPAFDQAQMLADGVQFVNGRSGIEQLAGNLLLRR